MNIDALPMPQGRGFLGSRSLRLTFLVWVLMPQAPYSLQGCVIQPTCTSLKNVQVRQRFFCMRSTFYVRDLLAQRPMLSIKEPRDKGTTDTAMDTIYSVSREEYTLYVVTRQHL